MTDDEKAISFKFCLFSQETFLKEIRAIVYIVMIIEKVSLFTFLERGFSSQAAGKVQFR